MALHITAATAMLEGLQRMGLDVATIRASAGLREETLQPGTTFLEEARFSALWRNAFTQCARDSLAVEAAQALPLGAFGLVDYLALASGTVGEALQTLQHHLGLVGGALTLTIEHSPSRCVWIRLHNLGRFELQELSDEFTLAILLSRIRQFATKPVDIRCVELSRQRVEEPRRWERLWGDVQVRFGRPVAGICLGPGGWETTLKSSDARLAQVLRPMARVSRAAEQSLPLLTRSAITQLLSSPKLSEARVAQELGVSTRSLQRKLRLAETSYRQLVDDVRRHEALRLLEAPYHSLTDVALQLGLRENASLTRAFKRWTGVSPRAWSQRKQKGER